MKNAEITPEVAKALYCCQSIPHAAEAELTTKYSQLLGLWAENWKRPPIAAAPISGLTRVFEFGKSIRIFAEEQLLEVRSALGSVAAGSRMVRDGIREGEGRASVARRHFVKEESNSDCLGEMTCEAQSAKTLRLTFSLRNFSDHQPMVPFYISVKDGEGAPLLERKEIGEEAYQVDNIPLGSYQVRLDSKLPGKYVQIMFRAENSGVL